VARITRDREPMGVAVDHVRAEDPLRDLLDTLDAGRPLGGGRPPAAP